MSKRESFEETMSRLFNSINPRATWESINRLDLFKIVHDDNEKKLEEKDIQINKLKASLELSISLLMEERDKLRAEKKGLEELLVEACDILSDEYSWSEAEVLGEEFLNRKEIKQFNRTMNNG